MQSILGSKVSDKRDRSVLIAYQECMDRGLQRFIIEDTCTPGQLEAALHLLLSDVWPSAAYRVRRVVRSGVFLRFEACDRPNMSSIVGEWIGNRHHGVIHVDAVKALRETYNADRE